MADTPETNKLSHAELRGVYQANQNVLRFCKEKLGNSATNEQAAIMHAYELQTGSYIERMKNDADYRAKKEKFGQLVASIFAPYAPTSILEAGVGEATTLAAVIKNLPDRADLSTYAFDLSWSRVLVGSRYFAEQTQDLGLKQNVNFFAGELEHIALADNSFDIVFTAHAIEPNHGRERQILEELYRVTAGQLILIEPAYELADDAARQRMDFHGYCRGLQEIASANGWKVSRHELFNVYENSENPSMLLVIEKNAPVRNQPQYVSPVDGGALVMHAGNYFNAEEGLVYPVLGGIPYLTRAAAILATHYLDA